MVASNLLELALGIDGYLAPNFTQVPELEISIFLGQLNYIRFIHTDAMIWKTLKEGASLLTRRSLRHELGCTSAKRPCVGES